MTIRNHKRNGAFFEVEENVSSSNNDLLQVHSIELGGDDFQLPRPCDSDTQEARIFELRRVQNTLKGDLGQN